MSFPTPEEVDAFLDEVRRNIGERRAILAESGYFPPKRNNILRLFGRFAQLRKAKDCNRDIVPHLAAIAAEAVAQGAALKREGTKA